MISIPPAESATVIFSCVVSPSREYLESLIFIEKSEERVFGCLFRIFWSVLLEGK